MNIDFAIQSIVDALSLGSLYALFALGIALIFGIMQLINFAHGELIMVSAYVVVFTAAFPLPITVALVLLTGVALALGIERVAFRPVRLATPSTLLVTSFAVSFLLQSLAILIVGATPHSTSLWSGLGASVSIAGVNISKLNILVMGTTLVLLTGLGLFLGRTRRGVEMRAAAEDFEMARLLGVRANRVVATAFALSGVLAAAAAILLVAQTGTVTPLFGLAPVLAGFIASVLGGMGSLLGAVVGGFVLGAITIVFQVLLPVELRPFRDAFAYALVIGILLLRPQGLIVAKSAKTRV